jgi:chromosome segregation ATPase
MLSPSDLYEIRKIIVASKLLDSGAFDADLAKIEAGIQAATDAQTAAIKATNDKVIAQAAQMQDELDAKEIKLQQTLADIDARNAALDAKQAEYNTLAADVGAKLDALAAATKKAQEDTDKMYADANVRTAAVAKREQDVTAREQLLAQGQQDLATKLAALKAISA